MAMFEIESGIPIPAVKAGQPPKYPFKTMRVGDSFVVPYGKRSSVVARANQLGIRITTRRDGDKLRVWRVA